MIKTRCSGDKMLQITQEGSEWIDRYHYLGEIVLKVYNPVMSPCIEEYVYVCGNARKIIQITHDQVKGYTDIILD